MKITALTENTSCDPRIGCEHGLSLYIEANGYKILFDAGQSDLFAANAERLGIDLTQVDLCVISHGHYDHGGGLRRFLALNDHAPVYLNRRAFAPYYNGTEKYIGLDASLHESDRLVYVDEEAVIGDGLTLYACNERERKHPSSGAGLNTVIDGALIQDAFLHEQYLMIEDGGRRVLFSACSHKGILNIAEWFCPHVLIGGFHLMKIEDESALADVAAQLNAGSTVYYTCHCTGQEQFAVMRAHMDRLHYLHAGQTIEI